MVKRIYTFNPVNSHWTGDRVYPTLIRYHPDRFRREDSAEIRSIMYSNGGNGNSRTRVNIRESERRRTVRNDPRCG
jgi:hypothetical protein